MSWDVYILKFDGEPSFDKLDADDFKPLPMGTTEEVRERISSRWPGTDWTDPKWGDYEADGCSIEFNLHRGIVDGLMLSIRGGGNPVPSIVTFCRENGWTAIDGDSFLSETSGQSWQEWQKYRDQVIGTPSVEAIREEHNDNDH